MSPDRHRHHFLPEHTEDQLQFVSNSALTLMMRQMGDLVRQAEDIFSSLEGECRAVDSRSRTVLARINNLQDSLLHQDSLTEIVGGLQPAASLVLTVVRSRGHGVLSEGGQTLLLHLSGGDGPLPAGHEVEVCEVSLRGRQVSGEGEQSRGAGALVFMHSNTDRGQLQIFQRGD